MAKNPYSKRAIAASKRNSGSTIHKRDIPYKEAKALPGPPDFEAVSLTVEFTALHGKVFRRDLTQLAAAHPHHRALICQLIVADELLHKNKVVAWQSHQAVHLAIEDFLAFLNSDEPINKKVEVVADINAVVTKGFRSWLIRTYPGRGANRKRYGNTRKLVSFLQKRFPSDTNIGPYVAWPPGPSTQETPSESYSDETYNEIVNACLTDVNLIKRWMDDLPRLIASGERLEEIEVTIENVMHDLILERDRHVVAGKSLEVFERKIPYRKLVIRHAKTLGLSPSDIQAIYFHRGEALALKGRPVNGNSIDRQTRLLKNCDPQQSQRILVATIASRYPRWPMHLDLAEANELFSAEWAKSKWGIENETLDRRLHVALMSMRTGPEGAPIDVGQLAYFSHSHFTFSTIYPFMLLVMLETGWNFETVNSLSDDISDHIEPDLIDPDYVIIYGTKLRGKSVPTHRSNVRDRLGVYKILQFVSRQIAKHKESPHYHAGYLWQAILSKNLWMNVKRMTSPITLGTFLHTSSGFLARHNIVVDHCKKRQTLESRRLRTTWESKRRQQGLEIEQLPGPMTHQNVETTVRHYDSDTRSRSLKNKRIRQIQSRLLDDVANYDERLVTSTSLAQLRASIESAPDEKARRKELTKAAKEIGTPQQVIHLLSPAGQTYIAACTDSSTPTWPGANDFVSEGGKCAFFNRCPMCKNARFFKESLPYIFRRIADLDELRHTMNPLDWASNYGSESEAWESIIGQWNASDEIAEAKLLSRSDNYTLPLTLRGAV